MSEKTRTSTSPNLTRLMIRDFRSIEESSIDLKPLSVIVGGNSAGKSSLLAVLRLLVQAQSQEGDGLLIELNGSSLELGSFADVVRRSSISDQIEIALRFRELRRFRPFIWERSLSEGENPLLDLRLTFGSQDPSSGVAYIRSVASQIVIGSEVVESLNLTEDDPSAGIPTPVAVSRSRLRARFGDRQFLPRSQDSISRLTGTYWSENLSSGPIEIECRYGEGGIPVELLTVASPLEVLKQRIPRLARLKSLSARQRAVVSNNRGSLGRRTKISQVSAQDLFLKNPSDILDLPDPLLYQLFLNEDPATSSDSEQEVEAKLQKLVEDIELEAKQNQTQGLQTSDEADLVRDGDARDQWLVPEPRHLSDVTPSNFELLLRGFASFLGNRVEHMGPLRQGPQRLYSYGSRGAATDLGSDAKYFAFFLSRYKDIEVAMEGPVRPASSGVPLIEALSRWAARLGVASKVEVRDEPGFGRRVMVQVPGLDEPLDWEKVGVGVSQVLPVLTRLLVAREGTLTLLEQPELHLHPEAQGVLAELLLEAVRAGRQILVETHSEAFIRRLRRLVLEESIERLGDGSSNSLAEDVTFIYVERDDESGVTTLRNVDFDADGSFVEWPRGFVDQASRDAETLIRLQLRYQQMVSNG